MNQKIKSGNYSIPLCNTAVKDLWVAGEYAWFEYHCWRSHDSADAILWYHDHQRVLILRQEEEVFSGEGLATFDERMEAACPNGYKIRFEDGLEYAAMEDELFTDPKFFDPKLGPPINIPQAITK